MSDSGRLVRIVLLMGLVMLAMSSLIPGSNPAWSSFVNTIQAGPQLPTFQDPSAAMFSIVNRPIANGSTTDLGYLPPLSTVGCPPPSGAWWECLTTRDGNQSYVVINITNQPLVRLSGGGSGNAVVVSLEVSIECWANRTVPGAFMSFLIVNSSTADTPLQMSPTDLRCDAGDPKLKTYHHDLSVIKLVNWLSGKQLRFYPGGPVPITVYVSWIELRIIYSARQVCPTGLDGITCVLDSGVAAFINGILFVVYGFIFIVSLIVSILVFVAQAATTLVLGLFSAVAYFVALPGAPPLVQGFIAVFFLAMLAFLTFSLMKIARGTAE